MTGGHEEIVYVVAIAWRDFQMYTFPPFPCRTRVLSLLFAVIFLAFRGLSNEYLVLVNAGSEKNSFGRGNLRIRTVKLYRFVLDLKLFQRSSISSLFNMEYLNILYVYFILQFESYIIFKVV